MAVIKCKMCGGDLVIKPGATVAECEYCGTKQTIPNQDDEKKLTLFARANRLRMSCEFDKAAGIYESIVADFPQEAEAYWGLVLCKYGIEYVDDPATGKKIPTCHRSSFDSILEDSDFEQAQENADVVARKVYREEAKQIEEIRKGIIEVSGKEEPYDIFICYKETDENGGRTVDSVIAQDVYDALTEKGYRVFFSRITLEDKLGQEYEPYIFAALNSAKIMLAFGTDYEYYNAVWVKNEWSRYLKLMAKDKTKHLIPCYKGIDAYDMPKEFAKLQAQDMGKVGAIQDLMRGIEKLLPKNEPAAVQKKVVYAAPADHRQSAQLDRGFMALEDGDWKKADGFFEEALNLDAHSAHAYIGKALAQERCRNLRALVEKRLEQCQEVKAEQKTIQPEAAQLAHIEESVQKCSIPNYLDSYIVKELYKYDLSYPSYISGREAQLDAQKQWWETHRLLSRAEQFAAGDTAKELQAEKKFLLDSLAQRIEEAKKAEKAAIEDTRRNYANFLAEADAKAEEKRLLCAKQREQDYQTWCAKAKAEKNTHFLKDLAAKFDQLENYRDSKAMAEFCRKRIEEENAKEKEEQARQDRICAQEQKRAAKRRKIVQITVIVIAILAVAGYFAATKLVIPAIRYRQAQDYISAGDYTAAYTLLEELGKHDEVTQNQYERGMAQLEAGNYDAAYDLLNQAGRDDVVLQSKYDRGVALLEAEDYDAAYRLLDEAGKSDLVLQNKYDRGMAMLEAGSYEDAYALLSSINREDVVSQSKYDRAMALLEEKNYDRAYALLEEIGQDGEIEQNKYDRAVELLANEEYEEAYALLEEIGMTEEIEKSKYQRAMELMDSKDYESACDLLYGIINYDGAKETLYQYAVTLMEGKEFEEAQTVFTRLDGYRNSIDMLQESKYQVAQQLLDSGKTLEAAKTFCALGSYKDADQKMLQIWGDIVEHKTVDAGSLNTVGIKANSTVLAAGYNAGGNVSDWKDIVAISSGYGQIVGLQADGTVVAVGFNSDGQCDVSDWKNVVAISAGGNHTIGLKADDTVVVAGSNSDGQCDVNDWENIIAISAGGLHTVGLKADGTVVAVGCNNKGQCNVSDWENIIAISAGDTHTVGLKADGTVVAVGRNNEGQCDVSDWENIVAISAGVLHTVGLKADGTVIAVGYGKHDDRLNVDAWENIVEISAGGLHSVGLRADGTVVVAGDNAYGQCNVGGWTEIKLPDKQYTNMQ